MSNRSPTGTGNVGFPANKKSSWLSLMSAAAGVIPDLLEGALPDECAAQHSGTEKSDNIGCQKDFEAILTEVIISILH